MTDGTVLEPGIGHNAPPEPIRYPSDVAILEDLKRRYPELETRPVEWEAALATFPESFTLEDADRAAALQDLLGQMDKTKKVWKGTLDAETDELDTKIKIIRNFFKKGIEWIGGGAKENGVLNIWRPRHQAFLDLKAEDNRRKAEEEAERQRQAAEEARQKAEHDKQLAFWRSFDAEMARARKEAAEQAARDAEEDKMWAEARAELAAYDARQAEKQRREDERHGREQNVEHIRAMKQLHREAKTLADSENQMIIGEQYKSDARLDALVLEDGEIAKLARELLHSPYLDDDQKQTVEGIRADLVIWREQRLARFGDAERLVHERRAREAREREQREAEQARMRRLGVCLLQIGAEATRRARIEAEEAAQAAKQIVKDAKTDVKDAEKAETLANRDARTATREAGYSEREADKTENRADRLERRVETATDADFGRHRGELGTVGTLTGHYAADIFDFEALRKTCGELGPYFTDDALNGAVYRWMTERRGTWTEERKEGLLPGVTFMWIVDSRITT